MIDKDLKQQVQNALDWEPSVDATDIGVSVDEGVVFLSGNVHSWAERAAWAAPGVTHVDDRLTVVP